MAALAQKIGLALSPREVARETGLSLGYVYRLLRTNRIPHRRFGRRIVVGRQAFEQYLAGDSR